MATFAVTFENDEGDENTVNLPCRMVVCGRCQGEGTHVNPSIDGNGLTAEDFAEDPDFADDYRSGVYDVQCEECHGRNVTPEIDREACERSPELKAALERYDARLQADADWRREQMMESRMLGEW